MDFTIAEAAARLGVSTNTIRRRLTSGVISGRKVGGKWVIPLADEPETGDQDQSGEVEWLREQLRTKDQQIDQLHQLLGQSALNASPRPWWRRLFG